MRERLEKAIPQKNDGGERLEKARGRLEKAITQKNDGGKGWKKPGEGWKRPYPRKMMRGKAGTKTTFELTMNCIKIQQSPTWREKLEKACLRVRFATRKLIDLNQKHDQNNL